MIEPPTNWADVGFAAVVSLTLIVLFMPTDVLLALVGRGKRRG